MKAVWNVCWAAHFASENAVYKLNQLFMNFSLPMSYHLLIKNYASKLKQSTRLVNTQITFLNNCYGKFWQFSAIKVANT